MSRKTIIITENQFNEICGTNTAYLDNSNDYAEDGTTRVRANGSVSDSNGEKTYSDPVTGDDISDEMAPETLWALLFRNGGHGLWGHWGSGLRADELDGFDKEFDDESEDDDFDNKENEYIFETADVNPDFDGKEDLYYKALSYLRKTEFGESEDLTDAIESAIDDHDFSWFYEKDPKEQLEIVIRTAMKKIDYEYYWEEYSGGPLPHFSNIFESNSELEGRSWNGNSYTNLTTKKTQYKQQLGALRNANAPAQQIKRVQAAYNAVSGVLNRETGAIKARKTARMNLGMPNQFQKPGGTKNSGNGKAHTKKKVVDPNVGTGFITYK